MFKLIYNIEQDVGEKLSQIQITREKKKKRKEEVNNFFIRNFQFIFEGF